MNSELFRLKDWLVIGPVGAVAFILGFWGFLAIDNYTLQNAAGDAIKTLGLVKGSGPFVLAKSNNIQIVLAAWLLPALALFGGAKLVLINLRRDMRVALARRARNHIVVCGLGETGFQIVSSMRRAGKAVVAITKDGTEANALACEKIGVPVLNGSALQPGLLKLAGLARADSLIVTTGSDAQNLEVGLVASETVSPHARRAVKILVETRSDWLVDSLLEHRSPMLKGANVEFRIFNTAIDSARQLLRTPSFTPARAVAQGPASPHIVLAGFGNTNREIARRAICSNFALPGVRAGLTIFDREAGEAELLLKQRRPGLATLADFSFQDCLFSFEKSAVWSDVERTLGNRPVQAVIVALECDADALHAALQFRACLDRLDHLATPVFVRLKEQYKLGKFLHEVESHPLLPDRLVPFGSMHVLTSPDVLLNHGLDRLARAWHEIYLETAARTAPSPVLVPWEHLAERFKASNRAQADHATIALRAVGYRAVAGKAKITLPDDVVEKLARIEHGRWTSERRVAGWSHGQVRDDILKRNPLLTDWEDLPEEARAWNLDMARRIPDVLARVGLGLVREVVEDGKQEPIAPERSMRGAGEEEIRVLVIDPMDDAQTSRAELACANESVRVLLRWSGGNRLPQIEQKLERCPRLLEAIEGWVTEP